MRAVCCINSSCLNLSCGCFRSLFGFNLHHQIKLAYFLLIILFLAIGLIVFGSTKNPSSYLINTTGCSQQYNQSQCVASGVILRIFTSLGLTFFILIFLTNIRSQKAKIINQGLWIIKIGWISALIGFTFLIGSSVFKVFQFFSLLCWLAFSLIQTFVIIDLIYNLANKLKQKIELGAGKTLQSVNYLLMLASYALAIFLNVYSYKNWTLPKWICITNSIFIGIFLFLALFGGNKFNGVLLSGLVLVYLQIISYITSKTLQTATQFNEPTTWIFIVSLFMLIITFIGMLSRGSGRIKTSTGSINDKLQIVTSQTDQQNMGYLNSNKWPKFHLIIMIISFAIPLLITQWNKNIQTSSFQTMTYWQGVISWALGYIVYIWSIICIKCYPDKDLSELESYFKQFELS